MAMVSIRKLKSLQKANIDSDLQAARYCEYGNM